MRPERGQAALAQAPPWISCDYNPSVLWLVWIFDRLDVLIVLAVTADERSLTPAGAYLGTYCNMGRQYTALASDHVQKPQDRARTALICDRSVTDLGRSRHHTHIAHIGILLDVRACW